MIIFIINKINFHLNVEEQIVTLTRSEVDLN